MVSKNAHSLNQGVPIRKMYQKSDKNIGKTKRTNIRIYLYQQNDTNKYHNIFIQKAIQISFEQIFVSKHI